jgi:hypothetical protein
MSFPITQYAAPNENEFVMNNLLKAFYGGQQMGQEARARPEMLAALLKEQQAKSPLLEAQTKQVQNQNYLMDRGLNRLYGQPMPDQIQLQEQQQQQMPMNNAIPRTDRSNSIQQQLQQPSRNDNSNVNFLQQELESKVLGLSPPKSFEKDGHLYSVINGNIFDLGPVGPDSFQEEFNKELGKSSAERLNKKEQELAQAYESKDNLNFMNSIIANPEFKAMRQNPLLGKQELRYFENESGPGSAERKYLIGQFKTSIGNVVTQMSKQFKGAFRPGEQQLVESTKPHLGDTLEVMEGKAAAITYLNDMLTQRLELEAEYQRENPKASEAACKKYADSIIDPKEILKNAKNAVGAKENYSDEDIAHTAKIHGMTEEEVRAKLGI